MLCGSFPRNIITQVEYIGTRTRGNSWVGSANRVSPGDWGSSYSWNCNLKRFRATVKMMVDTNASDNRGFIVSTLTEKVDDSGYISGGCKSEDGKLSCGYSSFRGKRASMEDFYDVKMSNINGKPVCLFGIFDGHGGSRAAEYLKQHLFENITKHPEFMMDTKLAISETFKKTDVDFLDIERETYRDDGSTASTAILVQNHLYVANVGDSRTVVSKDGKAMPLSEDHKPNRSDERKRIESAGGVVMWAGTWRVGGVLAMSRAFGNRMLKQFVSAEPEIQELEVDEELELIVLASDGLWDVIPNEDAVSIAREEEEPESAAKKLTETAFSRGSADNITCIVVKFNHDKAELVAPHTEQNKETELHQDKCKDAAQQQQGPVVGQLESSEPNIPEDPSKAAELKPAQDEFEKTGTEPQSKTGTEPQSGMEDSSALFAVYKAAGIEPGTLTFQCLHKTMQSTYKLAKVSQGWELACKAVAADASKQINELKGEIARLKAGNAKERVEWDAAVAKLEAEKAKLEADQAQLREEKKNLTAEIVRHKNDGDDLRAKLNQSQIDLVEQELDLKEAKTMLKDAFKEGRKRENAFLKSVIDRYHGQTGVLAPFEILEAQMRAVKRATPNRATPSNIP